VFTERVRTGSLNKRVYVSFLNCQSKEARKQFGQLKQHLGHRPLHKCAEVEMALRHWLRKKELAFYRDKTFELVSRWRLCINVF
jgi:hypothetical protein